MTLHNLATLLAGLGRSGEAKVRYRRALDIFESTLGAEHPHSLICRECYEQAVKPSGRS
jgi:hypothetical protein